MKLRLALLLALALTSLARAETQPPPCIDLYTMGPGDDLFSADNDKCPQAQANAEGDAKSQEAARAVRQCVAPVALTIQRGSPARCFSRFGKRGRPGE